MKSLPKGTIVNLIIGMSATEGIPKQNHAKFVEMVRNEWAGAFYCHYMNNPPGVHSKAYAWYSGNKPVAGFVGSPNYTNNGFGKNREILASYSPATIKIYYESLLADAIDCTAADVGEKIAFFVRPVRLTIKKPRTAGVPPPKVESVSEDLDIPADLPGVDTISTSLLTAKGEIHTKSGLNWGQRTTRNSDQAYLPYNKQDRKAGFFPAKPARFKVFCDDGFVFTAVLASDSSKAIETPENNSILGRYFRDRLGAKSGQYLNKSDLVNYGRTDVTWTKLNDKTFLMDFSV